MSIFKKISQLFFEEVDEETVYDEKTNKIASKTVKVVEKEPQKSEVKAVKKQQPLEQVKPKQETIVEKNSEPTFLNISSNKTSNTEVKPAPVKKEKTEYIPVEVISPIYGNDKELYNTKTNNYVYESSTTTTKSVLNTVFSPINGDCATSVKETVVEVDERIANMTIDDFLTEIDENQVKRIEPPHSKVEITSEEKSEKEIKEEPLTIENLSLFDDFKES